MNSNPTRFFATGAFFVLCGMLWGIQMSASQDHTFAPAHAHLNLIGFVLMSIFGTYYALTPRAAQTKLASAHFGLHVLAVLILVPGIVQAIAEKGDALAKIGSVLTVLSMVMFLYAILRNGVGEKA
jgi:cbb3-type cytochrome oxidase subunit 1